MTINRWLCQFGSILALRRERQSCLFSGGRWIALVGVYTLDYRSGQAAALVIGEPIGVVCPPQRNSLCCGAAGSRASQRQRRSQRHEKTFHHRAVPQNPAPTMATLRTDCVMLPPCCRKDLGTSLPKPKYQWRSSRVTAAMQAGELIDYQVACATRRCSRDAN